MKEWNISVSMKEWNMQGKNETMEDAKYEGKNGTCKVRRKEWNMQGKNETREHTG